ncbi:MAG TPA: hypothetical protein VGH92_10550 [Gaiellaceae bacterium]
MNPDGNQRLTGAIGALLLVPIAIEAATIVLGVHTFMSLHVFVGLLLIPPVLLKLVSAGWRFMRYYTRVDDYMLHGPPQVAMRVLAPVLVAATVVLFASGVAMGFLHGHALSLARSLHGPASVVWLALVGVHVLVYAKRAFVDAAADVVPAERRRVRGATVRASLVAAALVAGIVAGAAFVPAQHRWIDLQHGHHGDLNRRARGGDPLRPLRAASVRGARAGARARGSGPSPARVP